MMKIRIFFVSLLFWTTKANIRSASSIQGTTTTIRGGSVAETLALAKSAAWIGKGALDGPAPPVSSPIATFCAESTGWSAVSVGLLSYLSVFTPLSMSKAIGFSSLAPLYFIYKECLKKTYDRLGFRPMRGIISLAIVAMCTAGLLLEQPIAGPILVALTILSAAPTTLLDSAEKSANWEGIALSDNDMKAWIWMKSLMMEWAVLSTILMAGVSPTKAVLASTAVWGVFWLKQFLM